MSLITNAAAVARRFEDYARKLDAAAARGLRKIITRVDREQVKRLSGGLADAPGAYPVPARTGHLRRETFFEMVGDTQAIAGNAATYAAAVHEADGGSSSAKFGRRPYLEDAVNAVDALDLMATEVRTVFGS